MAVDEEMKEQDGPGEPSGKIGAVRDDTDGTC